MVSAGKRSLDDLDLGKEAEKLDDVGMLKALNSEIDPGLPITHDAIIKGEIPTPSGGTLAPAKQIIP